MNSGEVGPAPARGPESRGVAVGCSVFKVGGSLLGWPPLPHRLAECLGRFQAVGGGRVVLIAGGGAACDWLRRLDQTYRLGEVMAHRLALHCLDWTAEILAALVPGGQVARNREGLERAWRAGSVPVLATRGFLESVDGLTCSPLPESWDLTSDSIAARIAECLGADRLVLLKSARLPEGAGREEAARLGLVDPLFPRLASDLMRVEYLCLRDPQPTVRELSPRRDSRPRSTV
jgi:aspartokinase-like uncharacterized kinase